MNLSKKEILQLYLDRAYMGGGTFGIAAAADFYFGKDDQGPNLAEAAMLAGLFKAPAKYAPHVNLPAARARANEVLTNLVQGGFMTEGQVLSARLHPADVVDRGDRKSPDYFLDWAFEEAKRIAAKSGIHSMVARTTIDIEPAARGRRIASSTTCASIGKEYGVTEGAIVVHRDQRRGARHRRRPRLRRQPVQPRHQGAAPDRLVLQALCLRRPPWRTASRRNRSISDGADQLGRLVAARTTAAAMPAASTLTTALVKSINTVPVRLAKDHLAIPPIKAMAEAMGVESPLSPHKTMVLGISGMTVMDQATGYSVFAERRLRRHAPRHHPAAHPLRRGPLRLRAATRRKPKRVLSEQAAVAR